VLTGGCSVTNQKASNKAFKINTASTAVEKGAVAIRIANMNECRYGHAQIYISGYVFVIGGFDHDDRVGNQPSTL
jgi:hypothetical protein